MSENYKSIIDDVMSQCEYSYWEAYPNNKQALVSSVETVQDSKIEDTMKALGCLFPEEYKYFLKFYGGIRLDRPDDFDIENVIITSMYGIHKNCHQSINLIEQAKYHKCDLPKGWLPIGELYGNFTLALIVAGGKFGQVVGVDQSDWDYHEEVAASFTECISNCGNLMR